MLHTPDSEVGPVLDAAAADLSTARNAQRIAMNVAKEAAANAFACGWSEYGIAKKLGVDRMTVRRWLGKG